MKGRDRKWQGRKQEIWSARLYLKPLRYSQLWENVAWRYGFSGCSDAKESACNAGAEGLISGRPSAEANGYPLQYSCLKNSMDGGTWWATVHGLQRVGHDWVTSLSLSFSAFMVCLYFLLLIKCFDKKESKSYKQEQININL